MGTHSIDPAGARDVWSTATARNGLFHFIDICLRGAGQVMFQNNQLTGLLFFIVDFWVAPDAGVHAVAWAGVVGAIVSPVTA